MGKVINLGKARKAREREAARTQADANAIRHGRSKAERALQALEQRRGEAALDGAERTTAANEAEHGDVLQTEPRPATDAGASEDATDDGPIPPK